MKHSINQRETDNLKPLCISVVFSIIFPGIFWKYLPTIYTDNFNVLT